MVKLHRFDREEKREDIKKEIKRIAKELGKTPTIKEFKRAKPNITFDKIVYFFGSWNKAIQESGLEINPTFKPPVYKVKKHDLIEEFIRVANKLKCIPGMHAFRASAKYSWTPYKTTFGSWGNAVNYIVKNYGDRFTFQAKQRGKKETNKGDRRLLPFSCPLQYEPQNEYETIVLFAYLAPKLGFLIDTIRAEFPDAVLLKDGKKILCEFEYLSSNYIQHGHPQDGSCICICWRRDAEIDGVKIISLEEWIKNNNETSNM